MKNFIVLLLLLGLSHLSGQSLYETLFEGSRSEVHMVLEPNGHIKAISGLDGSVGLALSDFTPDGAITTQYRLGWEQGEEAAHDFIATSDGHYALAGTIEVEPGVDRDIFFGKITGEGDWLWHYAAGSEYFDEATTIINTQDGGLLVGGQYRVDESTSIAGAYFVKLTAAGEVLWEKAFTRETGGFTINDVLELPSGIIVAAGYYRRPFSANTTAAIQFMDSDGTMLRSIGMSGGGTISTSISSMLLSPEGTLVLAGELNQSAFIEGDLWLTEMTLTDDILWSRVIGTALDEDIRGSMGLAMDAEGNILLSVGRENDHPFYEYDHGVLVKTSRQGIPLWTRAFPEFTHATDILTFDNGDILLAGGNATFGFFVKYLYRLNSGGHSGCRQDSFLLFSQELRSFDKHLYTDIEELTLNTVVDLPGVSNSQNPDYDLECLVDTCIVRASIGATPGLFPSGAAVTFTNSSSNADSYRWELDGVEVSNNTELTWTFTSPGQHNLSLIALAGNCADSTNILLTITPPVEADFTFESSLFVVQFDGASSQGESWFWDFGDGQTAIIPSPRHAFQDYGTYEVCLTIAQLDETDTQCKTVTLTPAAGVAFSTVDNPVGSSSSNGAFYNDVVATKDGGYAVVGRQSSSSSTGPLGCVLQKYRADGSVSWYRFYGKPSIDFTGEVLIECRDLGFLLGGTMDGGMLITRTDSTGRRIWGHNILGGGSGTGAFDLLELEDGSFLVCGERNSDGFLLKLNENGQREWYKEYEYMNRATSLLLLDDGSLLMAGGDGFGSILLYHLDQEGELLPSTGYNLDGEGPLFNPRLSRAADGNFYIGFATILEEVGVGFFKINLAGTILWSRFFENAPSLSSSGFLDVHETADQHLFISYGSRLRDWSYAAYLEADGTPIWHRRIRHASSTRIGNSTLNYNDHLMVPGFASGNASGGMLVQIDPSGSLCNFLHTPIIELPSPIIGEPPIIDSVRVGVPTTGYSDVSDGAGEREQEAYCFNDLDCGIPTIDFNLNAEGRLLQAEILSTDFDSVFWDFGDLNTSTDVAPTHTYGFANTYTVCLTLYNECGGFTDCQEIRVLQEACSPVAAFTYTQPEPGLIVFTDQSIRAETWLWDFYDGTVTNEQNPTHFFAAAGTYEVCLQITNDCGTDLYCEDIVIGGCTANAQFVYDTSDYNVLFSPASPTGVLSWEWDFGDGTTTTEGYPEHTYAMAGNYEVCLTVNLDCGTDTYCETIALEDCTPVISISYEQFEPTGFAFIPELFGSSFVSWDFGDGNSTSTELFPTHLYGAEGTYTVCLTAENSCGETTYCEELVAGECVPTATFSYEQLNLTSLLFTSDLSVAANTTWDFGDGNTSFLPNPSHTYATPGTYTVCLTVYNTCGETIVCENIQLAGATVPGAIFNQEIDTTGLFWDPDMFGAPPSRFAPGEMRIISSLRADDEPSFGLQVWPNPVRERLRILLRADPPSDQAWSLVLLDQYGRICVKTELAAGYSQSLPVGTLPAGLYYYRLLRNGLPIDHGKILKL